jgi:hypothetical protein
MGSSTLPKLATRGPWRACIINVRALAFWLWGGRLRVRLLIEDMAVQLPKRSMSECVVPWEPRTHEPASNRLMRACNMPWHATYTEHSLSFAAYVGLMPHDSFRCPKAGCACCMLRDCAEGLAGLLPQPLPPWPFPRVPRLGEQPVTVHVRLLRRGWNICRLAACKLAPFC